MSIYIAHRRKNASNALVKVVSWTKKLTRREWAQWLREPISFSHCQSKPKS